MQMLLPSGVISPRDGADVVNRALDVLGVGAISDLYDGSTAGRAALRHYADTILEVLRLANWEFARKAIHGFLVGDVTGVFSPPGGNASAAVPMGWLYEYVLPPDCVKVRYVMAPPKAPLWPINATAQSNPDPPVRFIVASDFVQPEWGVPPWGGVSWGGPGSPATVLLTNQLDATIVYTAAISVPDIWDPLFQAAVVGRLASWLALAVIEDKKLAVELRQLQLQVAKDAIMVARRADSNKGWDDLDALFGMQQESSGRGRGER